MSARTMMGNGEGAARNSELLVASSRRGAVKIAAAALLIGAAGPAAAQRRAGGFEDLAAKSEERMEKGESAARARFTPQSTLGEVFDEAAFRGFAPYLLPLETLVPSGSPLSDALLEAFGAADVPNGAA